MHSGCIVKARKSVAVTLIILTGHSVHSDFSLTPEASLDSGIFSAAGRWHDSLSGPYRRLHDNGRGAKWLWLTCASRPWIY